MKVLLPPPIRGPSRRAQFAAAAVLTGRRVCTPGPSPRKTVVRKVRDFSQTLGVCPFCVTEILTSHFKIKASVTCGEQNYLISRKTV